MRRAYVVVLPTLGVIFGGFVILALFLLTLPIEFELPFYVLGFIVVVLASRVVLGYLAEWADVEEVGEPEEPELTAKEYLRSVETAP